MNLFIDTISNIGNFILFNDKREIITKKKWNIKWKESSKLISKIDKFVKKNNLSFLDLSNIVVVNWPGSFTWIRTTVLVVNTINYIINKSITPISFFDLYDNYPIIKSSSKRDCFVKENKKDKIKILSNDDLLNYLKKNNILEIYWEIDKKILPWIKILDKINYDNIIKKIKFEDNKIISPLYIKKPNIS